MSTDSRRITLIARHPGKPGRDWVLSNPLCSRMLLVDAIVFLPFAVERGIKELGQDLDRLIIDRVGTAEQYLELLAALPPEFGGDVLFVRPDGSAFLSAIGRGGDRFVYSLRSQEVDFYLRTHALVRLAGVESGSTESNVAASA
jgi:hypothetical protein